MFFVITTIQHTTGSSTQYNKLRRENKRHTDQKVEIKLFLFADGMRKIQWNLQNTRTNR